MSKSQGNKAAVNQSKGELVVPQERPKHLAPIDNSKPTRGNEAVTTADIVIPRVEIVQDLSPCRKKGDPAYITGAEEGMMYNTVTRQLYGSNVVVVPVLFRKEYLIWKDRKKGGGFRGAFPDEATARHALQQMEDAADCAIKDTGQHFCLLLSRENGVNRSEEVVVSMSSSKMKVSRQWNSLIRITGEDRFARAYKLSVTPETNSQNQSYFNFKVEPIGYAPEWAYKSAEALYSSVSAGRVIQADRSDDGAVDSTDTEETEV